MNLRGWSVPGKDRRRETHKAAVGIIQGRDNGGQTRVAEVEVMGSGWVLTHFEDRATRFAAGLDAGSASKSKVREF